ncbi:MAG TPA: hypothetical protein PK323_09040 [Bacteroidia bacterium]|nr:hypothetical protein [Bacteroidia bacterium]
MKLYESEMVFRPFQTEVNADDHLLDQIYLVYYKYHIGISCLYDTIIEQLS